MEGNNTVKLGLTFHRVIGILIFIYILYRTCLSEIGYSVSGLNYVLWALIVLGTLVDDQWKLFKHRLVILNLIFIVVTIITSFFVSTSISTSVDIFNRMLESLCLGYAIIRYSLKEGNFNVVCYSWITAAIILSIRCIFFGVALRTTGRYSASDSLNVNTLGVFMMLSIWFVLYIFSNSDVSLQKIVGMLIANLLLFYAILLTGSRKAFVGAFAIIICWAIFGLRPMLKELSAAKKILFWVTLLFVLGLVFYFFSGLFSSTATVVINRLLKLEGNFQDQERLDLMQDAFRVFTEHPIVGVGWNNYKIISRFNMYSHCTYTEVLACTGIVGSAFAYSIFALVINGILHLKTKIKLEKVLSVLLLAIFMYICFGQILYYNVNLLLIMYVLIAIIEINDSSFVEEFDYEY